MGLASQAASIELVVVAEPTLAAPEWAIAQIDLPATRRVRSVADAPVTADCNLALVATPPAAAEADLPRGPGAGVVADCSDSGWTERVREATDGAGPDVVFDGGECLGGTASGATTPEGRFSAHGAASGGFAEIDPREAERHGATMRGIEQVQFPPADAKRLAGQALAEAVAGRIRPVGGQVCPLERAADARAAIEARRGIGRTPPRV